MEAYDQGLPYSLIHSEILPQRSAMSIQRRSARLRFHSTKANDDHGQLLLPGRKSVWTDEEHTTLIRARDQGWSYARIRYELFPHRSFRALCSRDSMLRRRSSNGSKSDTASYRSYGVILKKEAVIDEELPPLPKEADLKKIKQENLEEQDGMAQEEEHHADYTRLRHEDNDGTDKRSLKLGEGNHVVANDEHLALPEEEGEDMDTGVDDEDLPHPVSEDEEEVNDFILADAEDSPEDEAAWEDECDDS